MADASDPSEPGTPQPRISDHVAVSWVVVVSLVQLLVYILYAPVALVLAPWLRARRKRYLEQAKPSVAGGAGVVRDLPRDAKVFVVAGEASGDRLAARVVADLCARAPGVEIAGYGGAACRDAGMVIHRDLTAHAVIGVGAVIGSLGFWWRVCVETLARFRTDPPDVLLTVDFPGLNVCLARWARTRGIRTVHLVAPQLWAHAPWRVVRWRRAVDHLLCTMPFEAGWFERTGIHTTYVGHPLFEEPLRDPRTGATRPLGEVPGEVVVEVLPGSRRREIEGNMPMLLEATRVIADRLEDNVRFVVRMAERRHRDWLDAVLEEQKTPEHPDLDIRVGEQENHDGALLGALATSGTVTAELAVSLVPLVTFYRVNWFIRGVAYLYFVTPWFCLANLVAGRVVVPERAYLSRGAYAGIAEDFISQVETPDAWRAARDSLQIVRERLASPQVAERVATLVLREVERARG